MNTTLKVILTTAAVSATVLVATIKLAAGNLNLMPVAVSYVAVVLLVALTAFDYRVGPKSYVGR